MRLDRVDAADRIDGVRDAALVQDDLLRAQRDRGALLGRQRQRFVLPLQCSDCVPPSTAASACSATRTMLLSGCCAVSVLPAVCAWNRSCCARGFVAPNRSRMMRAHSRRAARNFAISSRKSLCALKKNDSRWPNALTSSPASMAACT